MVGDRRTGIVVIGRNEGERLVRCLAAVDPGAHPVVYVDSGSSDDSVRHAKAVGASVVELDMSVPFTAARSRNAGFQRLLQDCPDTEFVQFVDGDCELCPGWLEAATAHLEAYPQTAVVSGRLRERHPEASVYNRLADLEWRNMTIGEGQTSGGNAMMRAAVFSQLGGFNEGMIGGEEGELCRRIRQAGFQVFGLEQEMALHDLAMFRFSQWWKRQVRCGHGYFEVLTLQQGEREAYWVRRLASILFWGGGLPLFALLSCAATGGASLLLLLAFPALIVRIARRQQSTGCDPGDAWLYAAACVLGKFAEAQGLLIFAVNRYVLGRQSRLIEHKS